MHLTRNVATIAVCAIISFLYSPAVISQPVQRFTAKNGLRVLMLEDHSAPVIASVVAYGVGARNEGHGKTGFAHLFEHMMFKGSENVGPGEHMFQIFRSGGQMNGTTKFDSTEFWNYLPANQLEMALYMEADRMGSLEITQANLDNQRKAVQEERRQFTDNQPFGASEEQQQLLLFDSFEYKRSVIGSMEDLNSASVDDVRAFFKAYYAPNNAVLVIAGDFKRTDALRMVRRLFEGIPRQPDPPRLTINEPSLSGERRLVIKDKLAPVTQLRIGYKTADGNTADFYALDILTNILTGGPSARLTQRLVKDEQLATSVTCGLREQLIRTPLLITASVRNGKEPKAVEDAIYEEIAHIASNGMSDAEIATAKTQALRDYTKYYTNLLHRAEAAAMGDLLYNDPGTVATHLKHYDSVTRVDLVRVAKQYLTADNRVVVTTVPAQTK